MKHVEDILEDGMSFIRRNLLIKIDARLCQVFPKNCTIPFLGRSIKLVDNLGQLPPVMDKPIYACVGLAKELWNPFTTVVTPCLGKMDKAMIKYVLSFVDEC